MRHGTGTAPANPKDIGVGNAVENLNVKKGTFQTDAEPTKYLGQFAPVTGAEKISSLSVDGASVAIDKEGDPKSTYDQR